MNNLRNSITFLTIYLVLIFGLAQIEFIEQNVLNFEPAFFVLIALAAVAGLFLPSLVNLSIYTYLLGWALIYALTWFFYWRWLERELEPQLLSLQFILMAIAAGLAFDVGKHLRSMNDLLQDLAINAYPNRVLDLNTAQDRIGTELTRARRYQHPLSILILDPFQGNPNPGWKQAEKIYHDLLQRLATARIGQLLSQQARETDLILWDSAGRFLVLCPETTGDQVRIFAQRLERTLEHAIGTTITWSFATFPDEALTFDELLERAKQRLLESQTLPASSPVAAENDSSRS